MNAARQNHAVAMAGGNVFVFGGCATAVVNGCQTGASGTTYLNSAEQYLPGPRDSWAPIASMNSARAFHTATFVPAIGKILVTGGIGTGPAVLATAELYDPSTNTWAPAGTTGTPGSMTSARAGHTATLVPNSLGVLQVLIVGGITNLTGTISQTAEIYDPGSNTFTATASSPTSARAYHTALLLGSGEVLLAGGQSTSGTLATIETFNNNVFTAAVGTMTTPRAFHTVTVAGTLGNDIALFIGGRDGTGTDLTSAESWNGTVASGAGTMGVPRESHTATQLPSGKVLVAGGLSGGMPQLSSEVWDPSALAFTTSRGSLTNARAFHTAIYISSINRVLVAGGQGGTAVTLSSAELYRPGH